MKKERLSKIKNTKYLLNKTLLLRSTVRRYFLCQFSKDYVAEQMDKRRGTCLQCGKCCELSIKCPMLKKKNNEISCRIYHHGRPKACISFPIDKRDLANVNFECGYYFVD